MPNKQKPGLAQADEATKKQVSEAGHEAQGDQTDSDKEVVMEWEEEDYMVIPDVPRNADLGSMEDSSSETVDMGAPDYPVADDSRRRGENDQADQEEE